MFREMVNLESEHFDIATVPVIISCLVLQLLDEVVLYERSQLVVVILDGWPSVSHRSFLIGFFIELLVL